MGLLVLSVADSWMEGPRIGQVSGMNDLDAILFLCSWYTLGWGWHPQGERSVLGPVKKKIQKEVQTLMMLPGVKHARNNSRMAGNHVSSWMIKTEGAVMGSGRLTGGEEWERFPEEADAELGTEGCVLVKRSTEAGSRWWRRRVPSSPAPTDTPKLQLPMGRLYEWPED